LIGTLFGAVATLATLGMAIGPWAGGLVYETFGSCFWLYIGSFGIGVGAVAIVVTFSPPRTKASTVTSVSGSRAMPFSRFLASACRTILRRRYISAALIACFVRRVVETSSIRGPPRRPAS
jgi:MFS family permease